jgi:hypothetical protein
MPRNVSGGSNALEEACPEEAMPQKVLVRPSFYQTQIAFPKNHPEIKRFIPAQETAAFRACGIKNHQEQRGARAAGTGDQDPGSSAEDSRAGTDNDSFSDCDGKSETVKPSYCFG